MAANLLPTPGSYSLLIASQGTKPSCLPASVTIASASRWVFVISMACSSLLVAAARSPMPTLSTASAGWASTLSMRSSQPISAKN
eukprot:9493529-Pyramimonas_sp.AAC.1